MTTRNLLAALAFLVATPALSAPVDCTDEQFEGESYSICRVDPGADLRLFLNDAEGETLGGFYAVNRMLAPEGKTLAAAMNAGMYHEDRAPVGLYIEDGEEAMRIITSDGPGNFGLLPNGVFCTGPEGAQVTESRAFAADPPACDQATQSGPMLVIDGKLHPRFLPQSDSLFIRNGIGVTAEGTTVMAISNAPVNFHRFARLFRDHLETPNALFLDGKVSRLYARDLNRNDIGFLPLGPILGVVVPTE